MSTTGIFFVSEFDLSKKDESKKYKRIVIEKLKEVVSNFDEAADYVMYKASNTAIGFDNIKKKPDQFEGTWSYKAYVAFSKEQGGDKVEDSYKNIYYGVFKEGCLIEIYKIEKADILKAFQSKLEKNGDTSRQNILDNMVIPENRIFSVNEMKV